MIENNLESLHIKFGKLGDENINGITSDRNKKSPKICTLLTIVSNKFVLILQLTQIAIDATHGGDIHLSLWIDDCIAMCTQRHVAHKLINRPTKLFNLLPKI